MNEKTDDIEKFLSDLKTMMKFHRIILIHREKNLKTLSELEITQRDIKNFLTKLDIKNYSRGPIKDTEYKNDYREFGMNIKNEEIYIKINYGLPDKPIICISFHKAEFKIKYPFINK